MSNERGVYSPLGASNHSEKEREQNDYYATDPIAIPLLLEQEVFAPTIWECACGAGHIGKELERHGYKVIGTDLIYRGYGNPQSYDFMKEPIKTDFDGDIITNPPPTNAHWNLQRGHCRR